MTPGAGRTAGRIATAWPDHVVRRRRFLARLWAVATVCWSFVRTLLAWVLLGDYGLDPFTYLAVDLSSSLVLGRSTPIMVVSFVDGERRRAVRWAVVTAVAYSVPDAFLFLSTHHIPLVTVVVLVSVMTTSVTSTVVTIVHRIRAARAVAAAADMVQ
ncbi:MAG: hypothetical protein ACO3C1_07315 [Ilumatobacteraceae bacterium]